MVGDYLIGREIGKGAFSVVWHARHRLRGTEFAMKEIPIERLSSKLRESLLSEVSILKRINHPNIIGLHDFMQAAGRIYLILEYCSGGDLSNYLRRHGRVSEATAKHFMRQLASGLQVLRDNNVVHRDLKPQNILLSTNDENSVLKIADFGFAKSLQPLGLAETLCGSPLYMAPEVMQVQKYDAKADVWSVGVILYQLVTGQTPFNGGNQIQLLQNILKSNDLRFPLDNNLSHDCIDLCKRLLRRNPVERLTVDELVKHCFVSENSSDETISPMRPSGQSFHQDCMPFPFDDELSGHDEGPSIPGSKSIGRSSYALSGANRLDKTPVHIPSTNSGISSRYSLGNKLETASHPHDYPRRNIRGKGPMYTVANVPSSSSPEDNTAVDSLEFPDDYVLVTGPYQETSSPPANAFRLCNSPCKSESPPVSSSRPSALSAPMPINGASIGRARSITSMESHSSPASGTSQGSVDMADAVDQLSPHYLTRIRSLQQCAYAVADVVKEENANGRHLEAFSVQLVNLAIRNQAMQIYHAHAPSLLTGSPLHRIRTRENSRGGPPALSSQPPDEICTEIESEFLLEVGNAEKLTAHIGRSAEATEMPDPIETIFQSALASGRHGAVDEMRDNVEIAASRYSKAVCLLRFLLVEAPSLPLDPPLSYTKADRHRLCSYIDVLNSRLGQLHSRRQGVGSV